MNETVPNEIITLAGIENQFEEEWLLVEDPEFDRQDKLRRGKVLCHSKNRDEVYQAALRIRPKRAAFLYTGAMPHHIAINL